MNSRPGRRERPQMKVSTRYRHIFQAETEVSRQACVKYLSTKRRCHLRKGWMRLVLLVAAVVLAPGDPRAQDAESGNKYVSPWRTPWTYEGAKGAEHWSDLDP